MNAAHWWCNRSLPARPDECSDGTKPKYPPIVLSVKRCQSVISTANANPVSVEIPRKQPSRFTSGVNGESSAIVVMALSSRSRPGGSPHDGFIVRIERGREGEVPAAMLTQPLVVPLGPRGTVVIDEAVPE